MKYFLFYLIFVFSFQLGLAQEKPDLDTILLKAFTNKDSSQYYFLTSRKILKSKADTANYLYFKYFEKDANMKTDSTLYYAKKVIPLLEELDSLERLRRIYERLHFQELRAGSYEGALNYSQMALTVAERMKDTAKISLHLSDKSIIYHDFEDYERGIEYGKKAFNIMNNAETIKYDYLIYANNGIGINFDDWGKPDSALFYHYKNLKYLKKVEDSSKFTFIFNNIGNTYLKQQNYKKAIEFVSKALAVNKIRDDHYRLATNYTNLGTIAYKQGDYNAAETYFKEAHFYAKKSESIEKIRDLIQQEAWYYKKSGDYKKALEKQEAFYVLRDSVFNEERTAKVAEMETKYETEKKERDLADTRATLAVTEYKVKQRNNIIFGSLGLALVLGLLGYLQYKQQKLKNRQLKREGELKTALAKIETQNKLQEQRLRISRDLHDNIGSQLTFVTSSVENLKYGLKDKDESMTQKLTRISEFTTQTIYELRDTIWAMNKNEITSEDLQTRIANFIDQAGNVRNEVKFSFMVADEISNNTTFSSVQGMNIYRIIQEAVNNALKYADASLIKVDFRKENSQFRLNITDDGKGFDTTDVELGNGLNNIKKRTKDLSGEVIISSEIDTGTTVIVTF